MANKEKGFRPSSSSRSRSDSCSHARSYPQSPSCSRSRSKSSSRDNRGIQKSRSRERDRDQSLTRSQGRRGSCDTDLVNSSGSRGSWEHGWGSKDQKNQVQRYSGGREKACRSGGGSGDRSRYRDSRTPQKEELARSEMGLDGSLDSGEDCRSEWRKVPKTSMTLVAAGMAAADGEVLLGRKIPGRATVVSGTLGKTEVVCGTGGAGGAGGAPAAAGRRYTMVSSDEQVARTTAKTAKHSKVQKEAPGKSPRASTVGGGGGADTSKHVGYTADEESLLVSIYKAKTAKRRNGDGEDLWENVSIAFNKQVLSERRTTKWKSRNFLQSHNKLKLDSDPQGGACEGGYQSSATGLASYGPPCLGSSEAMMSSVAPKMKTQKLLKKTKLDAAVSGLDNRAKAPSQPTRAPSSHDTDAGCSSTNNTESRGEQSPRTGTNGLDGATKRCQLVHRHLKKLEDEHTANLNTHIRIGRMGLDLRALLMNWVVEAHRQFNLNDSSVYVTCYILDRYFEIQPLSEDEALLGAGAAALLIASRWEDEYPLEAQDWVDLTDAFTLNELSSMEERILDTVRVKMGVPTQYTLLVELLKVVEATDRQYHRAQYYLQRCLSGRISLEFRPSLLAVTSMFLARVPDTGLENSWYDLPTFPDISWDGILRCGRKMIALLDAPPITVAGSPLEPVKNKFLQESFLAVAIDELPWLPAPPPMPTVAPL